MLINVEQEHIDAGIANNTLQHPVVLALDAATNKYWSVGKETAKMLYRLSNNERTFQLPDKVLKFNEQFEHNPREAKPFQFELNIIAMEFSRRDSANI